MKKVFGIFAHPDDEVLFGWPIFQSDEFEKYLIVCCDDVARKGAGRKIALQKVCKQEGIHLVDCLSEDSNFYGLPTRRADYLLTDAIKKIETSLEKNISYIKPDYIFTHNPVGEYGHGTHRLLFEIVSQNCLVRNLLITDICEKSNHRSSKEIPVFIHHHFYYNKQKECILNPDFYSRCKTIYDEHRAWTWNKEPKSKCGLFLLKEDQRRDSSE